MNSALAFPPSIAASALALVCAGLLLAVDRRGRGRWLALTPILVIAPLAFVTAFPGALTAFHATLIAALVVAVLARDRDDLLQSECALKLAWVLGTALTLSWAGDQLLALITGTTLNVEQWAVLRAGIVPHDLWSVALPLSMLAGLVLIGGAPFHFWIADLMQGGRVWAAPLAAASLQVAGVAWLSSRLAGIDTLPEANLIAAGLLATATGVALVFGAATLTQQRRPERRIGTLASLQGALAIAMLLAGPRGGLDAAWVARWASHLALALTGAGLLSRFLPVTSEETGRAGVLFRHHPLTGFAGMLAVFSLAGVPGTPGGSLWFDTARALAVTRHTVLLILLACAWLIAFGASMRQWREAAGIPAGEPVSGPPVPWPARSVLWIAGLGVIALGIAWAIGVR
jgi:NADH-quinone oxidoreductase subunit N